MPTIHIEAELTSDKLLEAVKQLSGAELEQFVAQVMALQARRRSPSLSKDETELLLKINSGSPEDVHARYRELINKRQGERLTEDEHAELLRLTDETEMKQADRLEALAELARLRGTPVRELMDALGIKPTPVE
jgi:uncharacterized protein YPO0396